MADACVALIDATRVLLQELHARRQNRKPSPRRNRRARGMGLGSRRARFLAAGRNRGDATRRRAERLAEPAGMAGARAAAPARQRPGLARRGAATPRCLLGADAEARPQQGDYAAAGGGRLRAPRAARHAARRARRGRNRRREDPRLYRAGQPVGREEPGAVWLSTYTRNLQSQIDGELDRLYPDPAQKRRRVVIRKGRENFLCLLNYEDAARAASRRGKRRRRWCWSRAGHRRPLPAIWPPAISRAGSPS